MFQATLHPLFLLFLCCMFLSASTELGPNQWIPTILENTGVAGILVLAYINGLMAIGRQFAGTFVHRLSPLGMLIASALFSSLGLFLLSLSSGWLVFAAATVFAVGVCFFWPTMLGYVNERLPATGALGMAILGGAGMLSVSFALPEMGRLYDNGIAAQLPAGETIETLRAAPAGSDLASLWVSIQNTAGLDTIQVVAILPAILFFVFLAVRLLDQRSRRSEEVPQS